MLNQVSLIGRLGKDPEIRRTNSGEAVASMRIATFERWTDKQTGEERERTEWHSVVVFNDGLVTKFIEPHVAKGDLIFVQGKLSTRKWKDQSGQDRYSTEVVLSAFAGDIRLLDKNEGRPAPNQDDYGSTRARETTSPGTSYAQREDPPRNGRGDIDDDIPF